MLQNIPSAVVSTLGNKVVLYSSKKCLWCVSYSVIGQRPCAVLIFSYLALSLCVLSYSASVDTERSRVRIPAGAAGEFSSPGSTFCADSYFGIRSTPVLPQWHVKDPGHSAKSAGGRLQLNTHTPYVCGFA